MTGCSFVQAPCIFIFASFFFTMVIVFSDFCQSYANLGLVYLDGSDSICEKLGGVVRPHRHTCNARLRTLACSRLSTRAMVCAGSQRHGCSYVVSLFTSLLSGQLAVLRPEQDHFVRLQDPDDAEPS